MFKMGFLISDIMDERREWITFYFNLGVSYNEILYLLAQNHNIILSKTHLKRLLNSVGLYRRKYESDILETAMFVESELDKSGNQCGYKWFHLKCRKNGLVVSRENVRLLLQILDPVGVELRRRKRLRRRVYHSKGPNFTWHIDGYDKLTPYGVCIHGCIDGYSRKMIWLEAHSSNKNPKIISGYYLQKVLEIGGCPNSVRGDYGTENAHVAAMQNLFYENSFKYGKSTSNTRIERLWGTLRSQCGQFWIELFSKLRDDGYFTGTFLDIGIIQFCFMDLIQASILFFPNPYKYVNNLRFITWSQPRYS